MKKISLCIVMAVFIVLGMAFAYIYGNVFWVNQGTSLHLAFFVIGVLEAIATTTALVLYLMGKKSKWVNVIYLGSILLCIPIVLLALFWVMLLGGLHLSLGL